MPFDLSLRKAMITCLGFLLLAAAEGEAQNRTFNLVNNCGTTLWIGINGSAMGSLPGGLTLAPSPGNCTTSSCPSGQTCNAGTGLCQLVLSPPANFSGRLWPMTGCSFNSSGLCPTSSITGLSVNCCATGGCETNTASPGTWGLSCVNSGQPPATVAELTLSSTGQDNYDVSLVDGFNIPVESTPGPGTLTGPQGNDYWCGNPGGSTSLTGLTGCNWLDETCNGHRTLRVVNPAPCTSNSNCAGSSTCNGGTGVCQCTNDRDCPAGQICGIGNNQIIGYRACGTFAGCAAPKDLCAIGAYFALGSKGKPCSQGSDCASNTCTNGKCTASPVDGLACNERFPETIFCKQADHCPVVVGIQFPTQAACNCPSPTVCVQVPGSTANRKSSALVFPFHTIIPSKWRRSGLPRCRMKVE